MTYKSNLPIDCTYLSIPKIPPPNYNCSPKGGMAVGFSQIGKIIRQIREALGLTQEQLAAKARIDQHYLSRIETGKQQPSLSILQKIAQALDGELLIDIEITAKTQQQQALDELMATLKDKSADEIRRATRVIDAMFS